MNAPSARGLFRATGKRSKPVVQRNLDGSYEKVEHLERETGAVIRDFYAYTEKRCPAYAIVTNPPFSECGWGNGKARWLKHALDVLDVEYMALLLNWNWPGAGGLAPFLAAHPISRIYLMTFKIDFTGQGAPPMLNAFFVWDKQHNGETIFRTLGRKDARQGEFQL